MIPFQRIRGHARASKSKELGQGRANMMLSIGKSVRNTKDQYIDVDILATDGSFESLHQSAVQYSEKYQVNLNENIANLLSPQEKRALHDIYRKRF